MRVLIIGAGGMAGHMLVDYFQRHTSYEVLYTSRSITAFDPRGYMLDVRDLRQLQTVIAKVLPDIVINAAGLLVEEASRFPADAEIVNARFPHVLAGMLDRGKLIQISTDCVFAGDRGNYAEFDRPDGTTVYARTKLQGEVAYHGHLTVRTSLIGPELRSPGRGLLAWFLRQTEEVKGFTHAMWNGVTTLELAKALHGMIEQRISGIYHLAAPERISKYELLIMLRDVFEKQIEIVPDDRQRIDRTLRNTRSLAGYAVPSYREMLLELRDWMRSA